MAPGESFDQTGFELTPAPLPVDDDPTQAELFTDDYSQPDLSAGTAKADAADGEPVSWSASSDQTSPVDEFVQPDLSAGSAQAGLSACTAQAGASE